MLTKNTISARCLHDVVLCAGLFLFVLAINYAIILLSPIFLEQPPLYIANQQIHSLADLLNVYLNPQMLYAGSINFFRPSGHFLIYQLLTPLLGWHNIKGLLCVNFLFLALTGYGMIKLYSLLFPNCRAGGYVAFCIFMVHPILALSRFMILQFDYSYAFFCVFSLYFFILFCQKNIARNTLTARGQLFSAINFQATPFHYTHLFVLSLLFYIIAVTFKEISLATGMALFCYFLIAFYQHGQLRSFVKKLFSNKDARNILLLLTIISFILATYISMQWSTVTYSTQWSTLVGQRPMAWHPLTNILFYERLLFGVWDQYNYSIFHGPNGILFSTCTRIIWWSFIISLLISSIQLFTKNSLNSLTITYKRSLLFLYIAAGIFLILPIIGGKYPWHLLLTLLMLSLAMGFSFEYLLKPLVSQKKLFLFTAIIMAVIAIDGMYVNHIHTVLGKYDLSFFLNRNAILHPPALRNQLTPDSVLVVEESERISALAYQDKNMTVTLMPAMHNGSYILGDSYYPFKDQASFTKVEKGYFLKPKYTYSGTLFRWAYLMPNLREEVYPFRVEAMNKVPDEILYNWLQNYKHIFAVGYDEQANWHDISAAFKTALLTEKTRRHLTVHAYIGKQQNITGHNISAQVIPINNPQLCQLACDKNDKCASVVFNIWSMMDTTLFTCALYDKNNKVDKASCSNCISFVKV